MGRWEPDYTRRGVGQTLEQFPFRLAGSITLDKARLLTHLVHFGQSDP